MSESPTSDRASRYAARLDAHLATLPNDVERRRFCDREMARWESLYDVFCAETPPRKSGSPDAADYLLTICEISTRQIRYGGALLEVRS